MSSNSSYNVSNESPDESPVQLPPWLAQTPAPITLSPHTIETTLRTQLNIDATLLRSIANRLLQTIANRETDTAIATKAYEDWLHSLKQRVLYYEGAFNEPPEGFTLNHGQVTNFHIPVGDGLYQEAKWIRLNDNGTVLGYSSTQGPNEQPYIIDLYAEADTSTNSPIETLPVWFQHMLTGPSSDFQILQMMVADTNNWGLAREITQYHEIDDDIMALVVKLEGYQCDHRCHMGQPHVLWVLSHARPRHETHQATLQHGQETWSYMFRLEEDQAQSMEHLCTRTSIVERGVITPALGQH
jgi:hypothetical protein